MKRTTKKLALSTERIRNLKPEELGAVAGGASVLAYCLPPTLTARQGCNSTESQITCNCTVTFYCPEPTRYCF